MKTDRGHCVTSLMLSKAQVYFNAINWVCKTTIFDLRGNYSVILMPFLSLLVKLLALFLPLKDPLKIFTSCSCLSSLSLTYTHTHKWWEHLYTKDFNFFIFPVSQSHIFVFDIFASMLRFIHNLHIIVSVHLISESEHHMWAGSCKWKLSLTVRKVFWELILVPRKMNSTGCLQYNVWNDFLKMSV